MASTADPPDVGKAKDDEILARFVAARDAGDEDAMRREWNALVTVEFDQIAGAVRGAGFSILSATELEDALSEACERLAAHMIWTFAGVSVGEWVRAMQRLAWVSCMEIQRQAARRREKEGSLYTGRPGDDADAVEPWARESYRKHLQDEAIVDDDGHAEELVAMGKDFLAWALPLLAERRRLIVELTLAGASTDDKRAALGGATRDVVYQTWKRAKTDLIKLKEQYSS